MAILVGNTFPMTLVRRKVSIEPIVIGSWLWAGEKIVSFWGHENTRTTAEQMLGVSLKPDVERPAITLNDEGLPMLNGQTFKEVYLLNPDYKPGFRPVPGREVTPDEIIGWTMLRVQFLERNCIW